MSEEAVDPQQASSSHPSTIQPALGIAVQDATDFLRATMTLATGAFGAGTAHYLATGDERMLAVIDASQKSIEVAIRALTLTVDLYRGSTPTS